MRRAKSGLAYYKWQQKGAALIFTDQAVLQMKGSMFVFELWDFPHYPFPSSICCGMETLRKTKHYQKGRNKSIKRAFEAISFLRSVAPTGLDGAVARPQLASERKSFPVYVAAAGVLRTGSVAAGIGYR